jgi:hypothetical protein
VASCEAHDAHPERPPVAAGHESTDARPPRARHTFRLRTCVAYHLYGTVPVSSCAQRTVDTRADTGPVLTHVPVVTLAGQPRPTTEPWGYFTAYAEVLYQRGSSWPLFAHSWPDTGLQGAGIAVAPQDQTTGTLTPNSTVTLDGAFTSVIGSGQPDGICTADVLPSGGGPPPGATSSHPAFAGAPPTSRWASRPAPTRVRRPAAPCDAGRARRPPRPRAAARGPDSRPDGRARQALTPARSLW